MKKERTKIFKKISRILTPFFFVFSLAGCGKEDNILTVVFNEGYQEIWKVGEIDFSTFSYTVTYKNGVVEQVPVDVSMVDKNDLYKFYEPGEWQVKFNFNDRFSYLVDFTIYENTFDESLELKDQVIVYDGQSHGLELSGPIPEGTKIYYPYGNSFTDYSIEPYQIKCVLSKDGYKTKTLEGSLTITQSEYSKELLDQIVFEDAEFVYDGTEKRIEAKNVPSDCSIEYFIDKNRGNSRVNAGVYKITGVLSCSNINYLPIANIEATLTIKKATYDLSNISFDDKTVVYKDGTQHVLRLTNEDMLPASISVTYENNIHEDVGCYIAVAKFSGDPNYEPIEEMTANLNITPGIIDLSGIVIKRPQLVTFNGEAQDFDIEVPDLVKVEKTYYTEAGALVEKPIDVGTYKVKFSFSAKTKAENYQLINIPTEAGVLIIQKKVLDLGNLDFGRQEYEFNNSPQNFDVEKAEIIDDQTQNIRKIPDELVIKPSYSINGNPIENPINVGDYAVDFDIKFKEKDSEGHVIKDSNYQIINAPSQKGMLSIVKIKVDLSKVILGNQVFEYIDDSTNINYQVNDVPEEAIYEIVYFKGATETTNTTQVGTYNVYVSFALDESKYSYDNYELVNVPHGSTTLTVQKRKIITDDVYAEDCSIVATGEGISFPEDKIINFDQIKQFVNPVFTYYENGVELPEGTLPTNPGDYSVDISFELKEEYSNEKYVIWNSSGTSGAYAVMHISAN